jgi:hypothetical protein
LGEIAVGDTGAEGGRGDPLGVDVDPLVVAGGFSKLVDARLVDLELVAVAEGLAHGGFEFPVGVKYGGHGRISVALGGGSRFGFRGLVRRVLGSPRGSLRDLI